MLGKVNSGGEAAPAIAFGTVEWPAVTYQVTVNHNLGYVPTYALFRMLGTPISDLPTVANYCGSVTSSSHRWAQASFGSTLTTGEGMVTATTVTVRSMWRTTKSYTYAYAIW